MREEPDLADVLDRVLEKGILIEYGDDGCLGGIDLIAAEARTVIVAIEMHLQCEPFPLNSELIIGRLRRRAPFER